MSSEEDIDDSSERELSKEDPADVDSEDASVEKDDSEIEEALVSGTHAESMPKTVIDNRVFFILETMGNSASNLDLLLYNCRKRTFSNF